MIQSNSKAHEDFEGALAKYENSPARQQDMALSKAQTMIKPGDDGRINPHYQARKDWKDCSAGRNPGSNKMQRLNQAAQDLQNNLYAQQLVLDTCLKIQQA